MGMFSWLWGAPDPASRKEQIPAHEVQPASPEALERRDRSNNFLAQKGVPTLNSLPAIEDLQTAKIRNPREVAERLIGCTIAAVAGETGDRKLVDRIIVDFSAGQLLTPREKEFISGQLDNQQQRVQFSWQYERAWVLLWALGYVERLEYPTGICDVPFLAGFLRGKSVDQLVAGAKPRTPAELLDAADLIYRLHWAVVDERVNRNTKVPPEIEKGVVQERHHALNWLIGYLNEDWDEVTTDT